MTETGFQYAVAALRRKRAELAGEIGSLNLQLRDRRRDMRKVDDILLILAPGSDPANIPAKKPVKHLNLFRQGQLNALTMGVLAASPKPMSNVEILDAVMAKIGSPRAARQALRRRVNANLAYLWSLKRVTKLSTGLWAHINK